MKYRQGFVSNSSSTSFCIYGISISDLEFNKIQEKPSKYNLEYILGRDYSGESYLGRSWSSIRDDETGKMFKDSVRQKLIDFTNNQNIKPTTIEDGWYDG